MTTKNLTERIGLAVENLVVDHWRPLLLGLIALYISALCWKALDVDATGGTRPEQTPPAGTTERRPPSAETEALVEVRETTASVEAARKENIRRYHEEVSAVRGRAAAADDNLDAYARTIASHIAQ